MNRSNSAFRDHKYKHDPIPELFSFPILEIMNGLHTIVVADDSSVVRRSVRRSLEEAGWTVSAEASNGCEVIEKAKQFHPQVVILDLSMPEMNGLEAARQLKQIMPEIHLILFTMHGDVFSSNEADSAGISAVFSKSDPVGAVVEKAEDLLHAAKRERA